MKKPHEEAPMRTAPLTLAQLRLWLQERQCPGHPTLLIPLTRRLHGVVRVDLLARCLDLVLARHDALRSRFPSVLPNGSDTDPGGSAEQTQLGPRPLEELLELRFSVEARLTTPLTCIDLERLTPAARQRHSRRLGLHFSRLPFDLEQPPLLRALVLRLEASDAYLTLSAHHLVVDNGSAGILFEELFDAYAAFRGGDAPTLPAPACTYLDEAERQRRSQSGSEIRRSLEVWEKHLRNVPTIELPTDRSRLGHRSRCDDAQRTSPQDGCRVQLEMPRKTVDAVLTLAQNSGVTPFMVLLAGLASWLAHTSGYASGRTSGHTSGQNTGQARLSILSSIVQRHEAHTARLVGLLTRPLLILFDLERAHSFEQVVAHTRLAFLDALQEETPTDLLWHQRGETLLRHPLARVGFTQRPAPSFSNPQLSSISQTSHLRVEPTELTLQAPRCDVETQLWVSGNRIAGSAYYDSELFEAASVENLHEAWWRWLATVCSSPQARLAGL